MLRSRGELLERPFAHAFDAGGMRRTHLRGHDNILKRLVIHLAGLNLGILMRDLIGAGTPRQFAAAAESLHRLLITLFGPQAADQLTGILCLLVLRQHHRKQIVGLLLACQIGPATHGATAEPFSTGC